MALVLLPQLNSPSTELKDNMATTYEKIQSTTLGSAAATITFSSIPATYTDIKVVFNCIGTTFIIPNIIFNNDTTGLYSYTSLMGNGSAASSDRGTNTNNINLTTNGVDTTPSLFTIDIFSYAGSTFKTCLVTESADLNGSGWVARYVSMYRSTSAINRIDIKSGGSNFAVGTSATLYGILKA